MSDEAVKAPPSRQPDQGQEMGSVSKLSAWKEYFLKHGLLLTSVASVAIALMAFFLTIYTAWLDRKYKELSIRPSLHWDVETSDFHVGIINNGIGPAEIRLVATKFQPQGCLYYFGREKLPSDDPGQLAQKAYDNVMAPIDQYFAEPFADLLQPASIWESAKAPKLYTRTLTPGQIIPAGQEVTIFEFQKETLEIVQKKLQTLSGPDYNNIIRRFFARAQSIPYYLDFCSLTGEYCVNQVDENCGHTDAIPKIRFN
jgi:hypothetical protein